MSRLKTPLEGRWPTRAASGARTNAAHARVGSLSGGRASEPKASENAGRCRRQAWRRSLQGRPWARPSDFRKALAWGCVNLLAHLT
jgi:hypothetical protein